MIKEQAAINKMRKAGQIVARTHTYLEKHIKAGITTEELNTLANNYIIQNNALPAFKGYQGFPKAICTSINEEVVHGIPGKRKLQEGDIISIDIGVLYEGYYGDSAWTYPVGKISKEKAELLYHTEKALEKALEIVKEGIDVNQIGCQIEKYLKPYNYGIVEVLVGHGIGKKLHEKPDIPNYDVKQPGLKLQAGMTLAIEPMINLGTKEVVIKEDNWTISTVDQKPSAHFEHTILVLENGCEILTKR